MICPKCGQNDINQGTICSFCHASVNPAQDIIGKPVQPPATKAAGGVQFRRPTTRPAVTSGKKPLSPAQLKAYRIVFVMACAIGALLAARSSWGNLRAYRAAGDAPRAISVAEAFSPQANGDPRWVMLVDNIVFDCSQGLEYSKNSSVQS